MIPVKGSVETRRLRTSAIAVPNDCCASIIDRMRKRKGAVSTKLCTRLSTRPRSQLSSTYVTVASVWKEVQDEQYKAKLGVKPF